MPLTSESESAMFPALPPPRVSGTAMVPPPPTLPTAAAPEEAEELSDWDGDAENTQYVVPDGPVDPLLAQEASGWDDDEDVSRQAAPGAGAAEVATEGGFGFTRKA